MQLLFSYFILKKNIRTQEGTDLENITADVVKNIIPKRKEDSYKGTYGKVLAIGGSKEMGGAIILAGSAAVHSGAGLVTVATDPANHAALHAHVPEAMVVDMWNKSAVQSQVKQVDVIIIGPGLGLSDKANDLLKSVFQHVSENQQLVLDGSALTLIGQENISLPNAHLVFTPHPGEWKQLTGISKEEQTVKINKQAQQKLNGTIVLKGSQTTIYFQEKVWKNTAGNPAMATGGMGDTLTGMIGGFSAQFPDKEQAVIAAVYLHSRIADDLAENQYVVLPSHIIEQIPYSMKKFEQLD